VRSHSCWCMGKKKQRGAKRESIPVPFSIRMVENAGPVNKAKNNSLGFMLGDKKASLSSWRWNGSRWNERESEGATDPRSKIPQK